jgi:hypothetical protein
MRMPSAARLQPVVKAVDSADPRRIRRIIANTTST